MSDRPCFHLSPTKLAPGSVIEPGNWGRILMAAGRDHTEFYREMALENARFHRFPEMPSRLECAFGFVVLPEAVDFRLRIPGFRHHCLYRVSLVDPGATACLVDNRLSGLQGNARHHWADAYWANARPIGTPVPWIPVVPGIPNWTWGSSVEMLTLSQLRVEEYLD